MIKKVAIMTFHRACNNGAFLQAYALQRSLEAFGKADISILDYDCEEISNTYRWSSYFKKKKGRLRNAILAIALFPTVLKRNKGFSECRKKYFKVYQKDVGREDLPEAISRFDAIVVGSDQVWNSDLTKSDSSYRLEFVPSSVKKFSYAASIGKSDLGEMEFQKLAASLQDFQQVSLREPYLLSDFQSSLGEKPVHCDVDPVFLLSASQWREISYPVKRKPYVLWFTLNSKKAVKPVMEFARKLANEKGIDALYAANMPRWFSFWEMDHFGPATPVEFLGLIDNAEYVVTNSFHGVAFSIIFHKEFFVEINTARSGRIQNLLELTGLTDRVLANGELFKNPELIDWDKVDARLESAVGRSKNYLQEIVSV